MDIRSIAHPTLEAVSAEFAETVHLATLEGSQVRYLDAVESSNALRVAVRTGMTLPAHCTSVGKALLAQLTTDQLHTLYPADKLAGQTERTLTSRRELERELERVRKRGFALNVGESEEGVTAVAAAVVDEYRGAVAALSVAAPSSRVSARRAKEVGERLLVYVDALREAVSQQPSL